MTTDVLVKATGPAYGTGPDDNRWHYVPMLGRSDYGDIGEIMDESNAEAVGRMLDAEGIEWFTAREQTWVCGIRVFIVDAIHPRTMPLLADIARRLEAYPVLDEDDWCRREYEAGVCGYCGSLGLPECAEYGDECETCGHVFGE